MTRIALIGVVLLDLFVAACKIRNEQSCDIPGNCTDVDGAVEACASSDECSAGVCKLPDGVCVGCLETADCDGAGFEPICNTTTNACEGCQSNAECGSEACNITTGACFPADTVAYLTAGGTGDCSQGSPCGTLQLAFNTGKPVIRVLGTTPIVGATSTAITHDVVVIGDPGPGLSTLRTTTGPTFELTAAFSLTVRDLELSGNLAGDAIRMNNNGASLTLDRVFLLANSGLGVSAANGNRVVVRNSVVFDNNDGGLSLQAVTFEITNTILVGNGDSTTPVGGFQSINPDNAAACVFEFNTIAENFTMSGTAGKAGVDCAGTAFPAHNNIVIGFANSLALDPACTFDHSLFTAASPPAGDGNMAAAMASDVKFVTTSGDMVRTNMFYRLRAGSPAIDKAAESVIATDIDGQARPQGAQKDIGADEVMP